MRNFFIAAVSFCFLFIASVASAATLSITPASGTQQVGAAFTVSIMLDTTGSSVDGVDIHYLNYDPTALEVQGTTITPGTLFTNTNANSVNTQNGKIDFSQTSAGGVQFTGQGTLATIQFKPLKAGATNLAFDFIQNVTTDSNVSSFGADVLTGATNVQFTIIESPPPPVGGGSSSSGGNLLNEGYPASPLISNIIAQNINENSTKLTWSTDVPTTGEVLYGLTKDITNSIRIETAKTAHEVGLSNLIANTRYYFQVKSKKADGILSSSDVLDFTTMHLTLPDPLVPRLLNQRLRQATGLKFLRSVKNNADTVFISFKKPSDKTIQKVNLWRSDKKCQRGALIKTIALGTMQSHQYTDTLPANKGFFYVISSLNDKGEESNRVWQWSSAKSAVAGYITRFAKNDTDCDGIANARERLYGTNPNNPDTDADGSLDGVEVEEGLYPNKKGAKKLHDISLAKKLKGRIILAPQFYGESYYLNPDTLKAYYLGRPKEAFDIMRAFGVEIKNTDLAKLPEAGKQTLGDIKLQKRLAGKILLQVEANGEAWYVNPVDLKRYRLASPQDVFLLMRKLSFKISNTNLIKLDLQL